MSHEPDSDPDDEPGPALPDPRHRPVRLQGARSRRRADGTKPQDRPPARRLPPALLRATIDAVEAIGFDRIKKDLLVQAVGESSAAFARHYNGKRGLLYLTSRQILEAHEAAVRQALDTHASAAPTDRATTGLTALTHALAGDPAAARLLMRNASAGPDGHTLRDDLLALIGEIIDPLHHDDPDPKPGLPGITPKGAWSQGMYAGAVFEILHRRIVDDQFGDLPALVPDLLQTLVNT